MLCIPDGPQITLAVLDRGYFLEYYGNRSVFDKGKACQKMFNKISSAAYDSACFSDGEEDFLRSVPCKNGRLCPDEDNQENVVPTSQLTYRIQDLVQSRYLIFHLDQKIAQYKNYSGASHFRI